MEVDLATGVETSFFLLGRSTWPPEISWRFNPVTAVAAYCEMLVTALICTVLLAPALVPVPPLLDTLDTLIVLVVDLSVITPAAAPATPVPLPPLAVTSPLKSMLAPTNSTSRSEERRVGQEGRSR